MSNLKKVTGVLPNIPEDLTSLHPRLSRSSMLLAWSGCPAFTGIRTTLSPTTTFRHTPGKKEREGEMDKQKKEHRLRIEAL